MRDEGFTTKDGHWLAQPVAFPDADSLDELLTVHGEWQSPPPGERGEAHATIRARSWMADDDGMEFDTPIGPYCSVRPGERGTGWAPALDVEPTEQVLDYLRERCVTIGDPNASISFEIIEHKDRGRALVTAHESQIISSVWLGYIDAKSVPGL